MSRGFKWIRNAALTLVIAAFVLLYGPGQGGVVAGAVAKVDGELVSRDVFEIWRERHARTLSELEGLEPDQLRELIDARTLNTLVERLILAREARNLGLAISNEALRLSVQSDPQYRQGGSYDPALVELAAARLGFSTKQYLDEIKIDLLLQGFERLVSSPVRVSAAQARAAIMESGTTIQLRYALAEVSSFRNGIDPPPEEVAEFLENQRELVQAEYERRRDEFERPEQVVARHILFTGPEAREQAETARDRLDAGEGFADVAIELSQDDATRDEAGLLGAFPRGRMLPAFEEVAFALEPGEISAPVETERGVHLILVETHEPAVSQTFDQVSPRLAYELAANQRAGQAARAAAEAMLGDLEDKIFDWYTESENFIAAAQAHGLKALATAPFALNALAVPALAAVEGIPEAARSLSEERPYVPRVFGEGNAYYVISLSARSEPDAQSVEDQLDAVREQLMDRLRRSATRVWLESRRRELQETGALQIYLLYPQ